MNAKKVVSVMAVFSFFSTTLSMLLPQDEKKISPTQLQKVAHKQCQVSSLRVIINSEDLQKADTIPVLHLDCNDKGTYFVHFLIKQKGPQEFVNKGTVDLTLGSVQKIIKTHYTISNRYQGMMMECNYCIKNGGYKSKKLKALLNIRPEYIPTFDDVWRSTLLPESPSTSEEEEEVLPKAYFLPRPYYHLSTICAYISIEEQEAFIKWKNVQLKVALKNTVPDLSVHRFLKVKNLDNKIIIFLLYPQKVYEKKSAYAGNEFKRVSFNEVFSAFEECLKK